MRVCIRRYNGVKNAWAFVRRSTQKTHYYHVLIIFIIGESRWKTTGTKQLLGQLNGLRLSGEFEAALSRVGTNNRAQTAVALAALAGPITSAPADRRSALSSRRPA